MHYDYSEIEFGSRDEKSTLCGRLYIPKSDSPRAIIQISHGMIDHIGRYKNLADFLCEKGYIVAGNDHLGHGKSVSDEHDYGYFAKSNGVNTLIRDLHSFNRILRQRYPNLPIIMLGHSMGSFLARLYVARYPHTVRGLIIHGTAGKNPLVGLGKLLSSAIILFKGDRHRSELLESLSIGAYRKCFSKNEGDNAWLSRDVAQVEDRSTDPFTSFKFTAGAYRDLFTMLKESNGKRWFTEYPKEMPTLIMSGECDPVGDFGKGVNSVYNQLLVLGATNLSLKLYSEARHELFNELCRDEAFTDILKFTESVVNT